MRRVVAGLVPRGANLFERFGVDAPRGPDLQLMQENRRDAIRNVPNHPMRQPQVLRVPKYDEIEVPDPTRPYDGLFFIAQMKPGTLIS